MYFLILAWIENIIEKQICKYAISTKMNKENEKCHW